MWKLLGALLSRLLVPVNNLGTLEGGTNYSAMRANMRVAFEGVMTKTARNIEPAMGALLFAASVLLVNRHTMQI